MTVQTYANFLETQITNLKGYICLNDQHGTDKIHWPLIAQVAMEARNAINSFVETEFQNQLSVQTSVAKQTT